MAINSTNIGRVAGAGFTGEKLVGNLDFFTVTVLTDTAVSGHVKFASTGVVASRAELVEAGELSDPTLSSTNSVTIAHPVGAFDDRATAETEYTSNADYDAAFTQQRNYDLLVQAVSQKAQPVIMSLVTTRVLDATADADLISGGPGSAGDDAADFRFAVEKTAVFSDNPVATDPKAEGVAELLDAVGDALRAVASSDDNPFGSGGSEATFDSTAQNFSVTFAGTL